MKYYLSELISNRLETERYYLLYKVAVQSILIELGKDVELVTFIDDADVLIISSEDTYPFERLNNRRKSIYTLKRVDDKVTVKVI